MADGARALCAALLLAACAPAGGGDPGAAPAGPDACGASGYRGLIGTPIAAVTLPADLNARIVREGEVVTLEFIAERLNLWVSRTGVVERVSCG